ncbi:MAG: HAMP domain-containing sensor histidine kinase [bacterium]
MPATKHTLTSNLHPQSAPWQRSTRTVLTNRTNKPPLGQMGITNPTERPLRAITANTEKPAPAWLIQEHKSLLRSNQELEHFAACAAHDLKSPINAALGWLRSLQSQLTNPSDSNLTKTFEIIERNLTKSIHQVNDILSLAKLNQPSERHTLCDMNKILDNVLLVHAQKIKKAHANIHRTPLPDVFGNTHHLESIFSNLIENSIKYREPERNLKIEIGYNTYEKYYEFFIRDNGTGVPESELENVFDLFSTVQTSSTVDSTGIGLAYCRKVVSLHGGQIWAESNPLHGVTLKFSIPK